ncbi:HP0495 family protein [Aurantivibrio infirmus]
MSEIEAPKIEFPCEDYPIKIMGDAIDDFHSVVVTVVEKHSPNFDQTKITVRDSRNGRYKAVTVYITATGEPQLKSIFEELKTIQAVKMVL